MLRTIFLLLFTMLVVPFVSFYFSPPLTGQQWSLLKQGALIALGIALACFIISELSKNYSQTDKVWSIAPIIYAWYFTAAAQWDDRMILMAVLVSIWGVRLSWNFNRRDGYSWRFWEGTEDYRWYILRQKPFLQSDWNWRLFNFFFISLYQNALIFLFTVPILAVFTADSLPLNWLDGLLTFLFLFFVLFETIADQQQWDFQTKKQILIQENKNLEGDYAKGFLSSGLWGWSRHPNYFAEQALWVTFYVFSIVATSNWINWSMIGCLLLLLLFHNSAEFSEGVSASKYPKYSAYQKKVSRFLPFPRLK